MTRWTNQPISTAQEVFADSLLLSICVMSYLIAVRLQEKRRVKITEEGNFLPKTKVERQLVQSYRGQLLAAGSNILPLLISVIFAVERLYTDNPYVKNVTLVNLQLSLLAYNSFAC